MKIISNRNRAPASLEPVPEEQHDKNKAEEESKPELRPEEDMTAESKVQQDVQDSGKAEEVKQQEIPGGKTQTLSYLTTDAMQLLDELFDQ